ncbi:MAG: polyhydroxyalkanoate synthesis repressor PhaR [Pseudomonadota bacterium]
MGKRDETTVIKKYANRRLYHTGTSTYVTLDDLAQMVKDGEDFIVQDAKSTEDITHAVLTQIIFEQEGKSSQTMLPVSFLRQIISFYGDQMQAVVPSYLEASMSAFGKEQGKIREQMASMIGKSPTEVMATSQQMMEAQTRKNMEVFTQAMSMFNPFMANMMNGENNGPNGTAPKEQPSEDQESLKTMREQIAEMQRKLDDMG